MTLTERRAAQYGTDRPRWQIGHGVRRVGTSGDVPQGHCCSESMWSLGPERQLGGDHACVQPTNICCAPALGTCHPKCWSGESSSKDLYGQLAAGGDRRPADRQAGQEAVGAGRGGGSSDGIGPVEEVRALDRAGQGRGWPCLSSCYPPGQAPWEVPWCRGSVPPHTCLPMCVPRPRKGARAMCGQLRKETCGHFRKQDTRAKPSLATACRGPLELNPQPTRHPTRK